MDDLAKLADDELLRGFCGLVELPNGALLTDEMTFLAYKAKDSERKALEKLHYILAELRRRLNRPLRFRITRAVGAMIWYADLVDTNGDRTMCNSGPIKFMAYKKGDVIQKAVAFAQLLGGTAVCVEAPDGN